MSREQSERFKLLVEQNEEKEKTLREENLRKLEEMKLENEERAKKLKKIPTMISNVAFPAYPSVNGLHTPLGEEDIPTH